MIIVCPTCMAKNRVPEEKLNANTSCGQCKMMAPHFAEVAKQNPQVIFAKINTEESPRLSSAFNVRSIPTLVLMNKTTEIARISGALRAPQLQQWLDQQLQAQS